MRKTLETADRIVKLVLAVSVVAFYFCGIIAGPLAKVLVAFGILVVLIFIAKAVLSVTNRD